MFVWNKVIGIAVSVGILFLPLAAPAGAAQFSPENNEILDGVFAGPVPLKPSAPLACPVIATNANTAQTFCSIQEANDAPTTLDGHTISVMAGTYTTQTSTITKSLTIIGNGAGVTLDGANATRVMTATETAITLTLQNITMTRGNGNGSLLDGYGGCLLAHAVGVNVALINVIFSSCAAASTGGGAWINGSAFITASQFVNNVAINNGGGVTAGSIFITASQFISNSAYSGGGAWTIGNTTIIASQFISNSTGHSGGGAYIGGSAFITASQFINNSSMRDAGGGAAIFGNAIIAASQFISNSTGTGGGGTAIFAVATITASEFAGNTAGDGGGLYSFTSQGYIVNSLFSRNRASGAGDAVYSCNAFRTSCGSLNIAFTTIASPTQSGGSAVFVGSGLGATLNMTNTIIVNHAVGISNTGAVNENFNYFDGNGANIAGSGTTTSGANHPSGAQAFVNPAGDDWRLAVGNPAINTGTDVGIYTDYFGAVRPSGSGFDIGYHELDVPPTPTPTATPTSTPTPTATPTNTSTATPTATPTPGASTAIELAGFYAETTSAAKCGNPSGAECVSLFWQTLREANTAGFVLLRGDVGAGADAREVSEFIQSEGTSGASYAWQDTSTQAGHAYAYWLREIALDGATREYGPVLVFVDGAVK